jgi:mannose-1-phosphate guanylyltransferase
VLVEPLDRGSAASILYPVHWIHARDPEATVVVFGDNPPGFGHQIAQAAGLAERHAESLILLGLSRGGGEPEHGFIVPGERIDSTVEGSLFRVRDLVDPGPDGDARPCSGTLGNVAVFAGRAKVFIGAAAEHGSALNDRLARATTFAGQEHERWALRQAYALAPRIDFFRSVLRPIARALAVLEVEDVARFANGGEERALGGRASLGFGAWSTATAPG